MHVRVRVCMRKWGGGVGFPFYFNFIARNFVGAGWPWAPVLVLLGPEWRMVQCRSRVQTLFCIFITEINMVSSRYVVQGHHLEIAALCILSTLRRQH